MFGIYWQELLTQRSMVTVNFVLVILLKLMGDLKEQQ